MRPFRKLSTDILVILLAFSGAILGLIWVYTRRYFFNGGSNLNIYDVIMLSSTFLIEGLIGLVFILKKEALQIIRFKGKRAVILGMLIFGWSWLIVIYIILYYLGWFSLTMF